MCYITGGSILRAAVAVVDEFGDVYLIRFVNGVRRKKEAKRGGSQE